MKFIKDYALHNGQGVAIDYVVTQKKEGKYFIGQILIYLFIAVCVAAVFAAMSIFIDSFALVAMAGVGLAAPVFLMAYHGTRAICNFDRKYSIFTTNVSMDKTPQTVISFEIVKDKKKKDEDTRYVVYERSMKEADLFAPYTDEYKDKYAAADVKNTIDFRSSVHKNDDIYFALFTEKDGSKTVIIFETVNRVVEKLAYYNKEATVVAKLSR
ncbi:MAG: hypothetical protein E7578_08150 [Ruminococcaceae bacterium]|nr:hypothetical protein [Oscillospiraceae bacterium]